MQRAGLRDRAAAACVGADRARRRALGALVDARREHGDVGDGWPQMRSEDLFDAHGPSFGWTLIFQTIAAPAQMTSDTATMEVVARPGDADDFLRKTLAHRPDVAVVDVQMPPRREDDGLRAAMALRERLPEIGVLVLSQF